MRQCIVGGGGCSSGILAAFVLGLMVVKWEEILHYHSFNQPTFN